MVKEWDADTCGGDDWVEAREHFEPQTAPNPLGLQKRPLPPVADNGSPTSHRNSARTPKGAGASAVFASGPAPASRAGQGSCLSLDQLKCWACRRAGMSCRTLQGQLCAAGRSREKTPGGWVLRAPDQDSGLQRWIKRAGRHRGVLL